MRISPLFVIMIAIVAVALLSAIFFVCGEPSGVITLESATRCSTSATPSTLSPKRVALFQQGMQLFIEQFSKSNPDWFVGSTKQEQEQEQEHEQEDEQQTNTNKNKPYSCRRYDVKSGKILPLRSSVSWTSSFVADNPTNAAAECWEYLLRWMPEQDAALPLQHFIDTVSYALQARSTFPVSRSVPWPIFLNEVLPYSVLSENRDPWRPQFFHYFLKNHASFLLNASLTQKDAAQFMNEKSWSMDDPPIIFQPCGTDDLCQYSPFQVLRAHNSSCTGLAIFLTVCCRSIGLPARVTGVPHWNLGPKVCPDGDQSDACGNHDWAETLVAPSSSSPSSLGWSFFDPDGDSRLNHSWFFPGWTQHQVPSTTNHSIFATSWASSAFLREKFGSWYDPLAAPHDHFPMVWNWSGSVANISSAWDVTRRYLSMDPKEKTS